MRTVTRCPALSAFVRRASSRALRLQRTARAHLPLRGVVRLHDAPAAESVSRAAPKPALHSSRCSACVSRALAGASPRFYLILVLGKQQRYICVAFFYIVAASFCGTHVGGCERVSVSCLRV